MTKKVKSEVVFTCLFAICLILFYSSIFYINFSKNPLYYDSDMYSDIQLSKEIWRQKTLFPQGWVFGNQVSAVSTPVLAALVYGIVGNGLTAMAIASSIMAVLIFISFDWMLKPATNSVERLCGFTAMMGAVFVSGHMTESLSGMQLFFTMASYYSCYMITAFLAFGCYIRARENKTGKLFWAVLILTCILSFGTGMHSLRQTEFMTVPLIACEGLFVLSDMIKNKSLKGVKTKSFLTCLLISVSNIAGLIAVRFFSFNQMTTFEGSGNGGFAALKEDLLNSLVKFAGLFFQAGDEGRKLPDLILSSLFLLAFVTAFAFVLKEAVKKKKPDSIQIIIFLLFISFVETYLLDIFTVMEIRRVYYFMLYPLFGLSAVYIFKKSERKKAVIAAVAAVLSISAFGLNGAQAIKETAAKTDWQVYSDMSECILSNGYDTLYSEWDYGSKVAAASDEKIECGFWVDKGDVDIYPIEYLCNPSVFDEENNSKAVYLVEENRIDELTKAAQENGVYLQLLESFSGESADYYVYKASKPLCMLIMEKSVNNK